MTAFPSTNEVKIVCSRTICGLIAVLALGSCKVNSLDNSVFSCVTSSDCASGEICLEQICRSPASLDGGAPEEGSCTPACEPTQMCCGTSCVNLASDNANCGTCGTTCDTGTHMNCYAGTCTAETSCSDGIDNNGDGLIDCQDTIACVTKTACHNGGHCCNAQCAFENNADLCSDGLDDDCNGLTDCQDPGCTGQPCGTGSVCNASMQCAPGCMIDGTFYAPQDSNSAAPCLICDPATNTQDWTPAASGTASGKCSGGQACDGSGECRRATGQPCSGDGDCATKMCGMLGLCM